MRRLRVYLPANRLWRFGPRVRALDGLDLDLAAGEVVALIGEHGCGGSTLARVLAGELAPTAGSVRLAGDASPGSASPRHGLYRQVQRIAPPEWPRRQQRLSVARWLGGVVHGEPLAAALREVGLAPELAGQRLSAFDAGQALRLQLARALATRPAVLICDRIERGLGSEQRGELWRCLRRIGAGHRLAQLVITDDLDWVRYGCRRVVVLYLGRVMEQGPSAAVLDAPAHPYTQALLAAAAGEHGRILQGERPDPRRPPMGCVFHPRCPMAEAVCVRTAPHLQRSRVPGHYAACHFAPRDV
ncbi:MAG: ABC transporter ATP-binding protein [Gammaproteobacteria bacterium]|nr:ABC transporter ATP-binding protein [Gammaproteobacteria bacterium]